MSSIYIEIKSLKTYQPKVIFLNVVPFSLLQATTHSSVIQVNRNLVNNLLSSTIIFVKLHTNLET